MVRKLTLPEAADFGRKNSCTLSLKQKKDTKKIKSNHSHAAGQKIKLRESKINAYLKQ